MSDGFQTVLLSSETVQYRPEPESASLLDARVGVLLIKGELITFGVFLLFCTESCP